MRTARLLRLAEHLSTVKPADFNLNIWLSTKSGCCSTVGCAIGHAANIPEFQEEGFYLAIKGTAMIPTYRGERDWAAVCEFFQINQDEADFLFKSRSYEDLNDTHPLTVAARIREFVNEQGIIK